MKPSYNIKYAFENKIKYGHVRSVLDKVSNILRKIRNKIDCLKEVERKKVIESNTQVRNYFYLLLVLLILLLIFINIVLERIC